MRCTFERIIIKKIRITNTISASTMVSTHSCWWMANKLNFMLKPNYYILMSARMTEIFHNALRTVSALFCPRRICCQYCDIWKFMFLSREMNFALSQFHVLWIFIIHLCSTISHLFSSHSIYIRRASGVEDHDSSQIFSVNIKY